MPCCWSGLSPGLQCGFALDYGLSTVLEIYSKAIAPVRGYFSLMNFWSWWSTINWGNAPAWVSGILTSVSVFLAVWILRRDKRKEIRKSADNFVTWASFVIQRSGAERTTNLHVGSFNAGSTPIIRPYIVTFEPDFTLTVGRLGVSEGQLETVIYPGAQNRNAMGDHFNITPGNAFVQFTDSSGNTWRRDLVTNRYISNFTIYRFYWRNLFTFGKEHRTWRSYLQ